MWLSFVTHPEATWSHTWRFSGRVGPPRGFCRWRRHLPGSRSWWLSRNLLLIKNKQLHSEKWIKNKVQKSFGLTANLNKYSNYYDNTSTTTENHLLKVVRLFSKRSKALDSPANSPTLDWPDSKGQRAWPTSSSPTCSIDIIWGRNRTETHPIVFYSLLRLRTNTHNKVKEEKKNVPSHFTVVQQLL